MEEPFDDPAEICGINTYEGDGSDAGAPPLFLSPDNRSLTWAQIKDALGCQAMKCFPRSLSRHDAMGDWKTRLAGEISG